ncbi:MAG: sigma-70 family RNA polymerase sigma factor [Micromonosporaceae bacterium]
MLVALHHEHAGALYAHALRLTSGDAGQAEELVQEALLRAWQNPQVFDPARGSVRGWLFTTVRNLAIDAWRRRQARPAEVELDGAAEPHTPDQTDRALESWMVADALSALSQDHRRVLLECFYRGESVAGAAARLGIPTGTVKSRLHYALRSLRVVLEERGVTR